MVVRALPTGSVTPPNRQPPEADIVHDHIRLRQHQIGAIARFGVSIGAWHMKQAGAAGCSETVGGSSRGSQLSPGGRSAKMISDGCPDANGKVLVEGSARTCCQRPAGGGFWRPGPPVAAPGAGNSDIDLFF